MAAYRAAARRFPGLHQPLVGIAMEYARMSNVNLALQCLQNAAALAPQCAACRPPATWAHTCVGSARTAGAANLHPKAADCQAQGARQRCGAHSAASAVVWSTRGLTPAADCAVTPQGTRWCATRWACSCTRRRPGARQRPSSCRRSGPRQPRARKVGPPAQAGLRCVRCTCSAQRAAGIVAAARLHLPRV